MILYYFCLGLNNYNVQHQFSTIGSTIPNYQLNRNFPLSQALPVPPPNSTVGSRQISETDGSAPNLIGTIVPETPSETIMSAPSLIRNFVPETPGETLMSAPVNPVLPRGLIDKEAALLLSFGLNRNILVNIPTREMCDNVNTYNRHWLTYLGINPKSFVHKEFTTNDEPNDQYHTYMIKLGNFPLEKAVKFIPFELKCDYGSSGQESIINQHWFSWAKCTLIPADPQLYSVSALEYGVRLAAYRIAYLITEAADVECANFSTDFSTMLAGIFEYSFPELMTKFDELKSVIEKIESCKSETEEEILKRLNWTPEQYKDAIRLVAGYKKTKIRNDTLAVSII